MEHLLFINIFQRRQKAYYGVKAKSKVDAKHKDLKRKFILMENNYRASIFLSQDIQTYRAAKGSQ